MALSLYDTIVPTYLQTIGAVRGQLDKGLEYATSRKIDPQMLVEARLIADMHPLNFQIQRVASLSAGALQDVGKGSFTMPKNEKYDYAGLQKLLVDAEATVSGFTREAVNALEGKPMNFDTGTFKAAFTVEAYLLSFTLPNFYFHSVTAYDILRANGVPVGKRDFTGQMRMKIG